MIQEMKMPIEVRLIVSDKELPDSFELLRHLQDIVDDWCWKQIPTIPCGVITKG